MSADGVVSAFADGELGFVDEDALAAWIARQRWYATKGREIGRASVVQALPLGGEPTLVLALVELRFQTGTWDLYQVLVGLRPVADGINGESICEVDGWVLHGALADPAHCRERRRWPMPSACARSRASRATRRSSTTSRSC